MKYIRAHSITSLLCLSFSLEINGIKKIIKRKRRARLVSVSFLSLCSSFLGQRDVSFGAAAARYVVVVVVVVSTSKCVLAVDRNGLLSAFSREERLCARRGVFVFVFENTNEIIIEYYQHRTHANGKTAEHDEGDVLFARFVVVVV